MKKILIVSISTLILFGFLLADNKCKKKSPKPKKIILGSLSSYFISSFATAIYQKKNPGIPFNQDQISIRKTPKDCRTLKTDCNIEDGKFQRYGDMRYDDFYCICLY